MDNLQFRAWDKENQVMREVVEIDFINKSVICETDDERTIKLYDTTYKLMQSTGLRDKDGYNTYESDFVEILTVRGGYYDSGLIKKKNGFLYIETKNKSIMLLSDFYFEGYTDSLELHVVGNVYEIALEELL